MFCNQVLHPCYEIRVGVSCDLENLSRVLTYSRAEVENIGGKNRFSIFYKCIPVGEF